MSAAMAWCQVLAQGSGPNLDEMYRRLAALEQQNLGRTYTDDDIAGRFERLELKLLGHLQSGNYQRRLDELLLRCDPGTSVSPANLRHRCRFRTRRITSRISRRSIRLTRPATTKIIGLTFVI